MPLAGYEQAARYREALYRVFGEELEFVPPGLILETDRDEWRIFKEELLATGRADIAALAANFSIIQLFNPVGSNRIATVFNCFVQGTAAVTFFTGFSAIPLTTLSANAFLLDRRGPAILGGSARGMLQLRTSQQAATPADESLYKEVANNAGVRDSPMHAILAPGTGIHLRAGAVNLAVSGGFEYYERPARAEELAA